MKKQAKKPALAAIDPMPIKALAGWFGGNRVLAAEDLTDDLYRFSARTSLQSLLTNRRLKDLFGLDMVGQERRMNGNWFITGHGSDWLRSSREKKRRPA